MDISGMDMVESMGIMKIKTIILMTYEKLN